MALTFMPMLRSTANGSVRGATSPRFAVAGVLLASLALGGCGEDPTPVEPSTQVDAESDAPDAVLDDDAATDATEDVAQPDTSGTDAVDPDAQADDTADVEADTDTDDTSGPNCPGEAGCDCTSVDQCDSGYCIETPDGQKCAATCVSGCQDENYKCVTGDGTDASNICVPKWGKICNPCNANADCQSTGNATARCVAGGDNGSFCGSACTADPDCPAGYACSTVKDVTGNESKQCVVQDGGACKCSLAAIKLELSTQCFVVAGESKCEGKRSCLGAASPGAPAGGGLTSCYAPTPEPEVCDGKDSDCDGQTDESTCDDGNPCTDDSCAGAGGCKSLNKSGPCDADGSVCTKDDSCQDGKCVAGATQTCDDGNPCTKDTCDPTEGCKYTNDDGAPCNADDNECTVADSCLAGACEAGKAKACVTEDQCEEGKCSKLAGGKCVYSFKEGQPCNDGNPCTAAEKCKKDEGQVDGKCAGDALNCDDLNACTADSCDPQTGCTHTAAGGACSDGDACTENDACKDGACTGTAKDPKTCDDGNPCTQDGCNAKQGCTNAPQSGVPCDDGNGCTEKDECTNGTCTSGQNKCTCTKDADCAGEEDGNFCNGTLYCDKGSLPYSCKVDAKTVKSCDTSVNNACQTNTCDPGTGACKLIKKLAGTPCDADKSVCTQNDACDDGACLAGKVQVCNDNNPCTDDSCDPTSGCKYVPNTAPCDADSNACTENDACSAGSCIAGKLKVCDDKEDCTQDLCDIKDATCKYVPQQKSCSDGNQCTTTDACGDDAKTGNFTCIGGPAKNCDDSNVCTVDTCDPAQGCSNAIDATIKQACYTGDPKTKGKGICKEGTQQCGVDGQLGACAGEVLPVPGKEACDGLDNNCDGVIDEGCAPTAFRVRFASTLVKGKGGKYEASVQVGGNNAVGNQAQGTKFSVELGFYRWLQALLKP